MVIHHCQICDVSAEKTITKRLVMDHDHKTGMIRGHLCDLCNSWLWFIEHNKPMNNTKILDWSLTYLSEIDQHLSRKSDITYKQYKKDQKKLKKKIKHIPVISKEEKKKSKSKNRKQRKREFQEAMRRKHWPEIVRHQKSTYLNQTRRFSEQLIMTKIETIYWINTNPCGNREIEEGFIRLLKANKIGAVWDDEIKQPKFHIVE